jgi:hypothetical protein
MEEGTNGGPSGPDSGGYDPVGLRAMLVGAPLLDARGVYAREALDAHVNSITNFLRHAYPIDDADMEAVLRDLEGVRAMSSESEAGLACKRALLLFAMHMEDEVAEHFVVLGGADGRLAADLRDRLLPRLVPEYVGDMCQRPDVFVRMASVMHEMWPHESFTQQAAAAAAPAASGGPVALTTDGGPLARA